MKHITVKSFICASVDQTISAMADSKRNAFGADRKLDNPM
ncbi:hypothetical protein VIBR0546_01321 [Vibrio brasiliensis LMG 20546]|jgi:hypothetical protein|uniref:Uncharacterized protein n=1 Tax=Vibrio brasiliensis LMG 20546 TaxID=945543 RepID=E8LPN8_9VIBR|nr:hypothetical protein VIBR0546_01321 [Vibrio brasiliensis LMG 20546]